MEQLKKEAVKVIIDAGLHEQIKNKPGRRGNISTTVEKALRAYLHPSAQAATSNIDTPFPNNYHAIKDSLVEHFGAAKSDIKVTGPHLVRMLREGQIRDVLQTQIMSGVKLHVAHFSADIPQDQLVERWGSMLNGYNCTDPAQEIRLDYENLVGLYQDTQERADPERILLYQTQYAPSQELVLLDTFTPDARALLYLATKGVLLFSQILEADMRSARGTTIIEGLTQNYWMGLALGSYKPFS